MLKIRLSRTGKKQQPSYRLVVQEHTAPIKGKFLEVVGFYRPADDPKVLEVDLERVKHWISVGAQPSDRVAVLLKTEGLEGMEKYIGPRNKKRRKKKEVEEKPEAPAAATPAPAPEAPAEEAPAPEAPVEEAPKEEAPAEEPKAEEAPAEETPKEEVPVEEPKEEEAPAAEEPKEEAPAE